MKKSSQVIGLPLIGVREGTELGNASDFIIDAAEKKVRYIVFQGSQGYFGYSALPVSKVKGIGNDYIVTSTITNSEKLFQSKDTKDMGDNGFFILDANVVSCGGDALGSVADFAFDEKTGDIVMIFLENGIEISGDKIASLSRELVFVDEIGTDEAAEEEESIAAEEPAEEETADEAVVEPEVQAEEVNQPSAVEREQHDFLIGRTVVTDVLDDDGAILVAQGTEITEEVFAKANAAGKLLDLTLSVE